MLLDKNGTPISIGDVISVDFCARQYSTCKLETGWIVKGFNEDLLATEAIVEHSVTQEVAYFPLLNVERI
jgi:hypothetical protein